MKTSAPARPPPPARPAVPEPPRVDGGADELFQQFESHLALGATSSARSVASVLAARFPRHVLAAVAQGRLELESGRTDAAAVLLERAAVGADADVAPALEVLAEVRRVAGRVDEAHALASRVVAVRPESPGAARTLGLVCAARGDTAGAQKWLQRVLSARPDDVACWKALAGTLRAQRRFIPATQALQHVLARNPADVDAWCTVVKCHAELGDMDAAREEVLKGLSAAPRNAELLQLAHQVRSLATTTNHKVRDALELVRQKMDEGKLDLAEKQLRTLFAANRPTRAMKFVRAELDAARAGADVSSAVVAAHALTREYPEAWEPRALLADLHLRPTGIRNIKLAVDHADEAWTMSGGHPRAGVVLAQALVAQGKVGLAQALGRQLSALGADVAARVARVVPR